MGAAMDDIPGAVAVWLIDGVPLRALAARVAGARLERHAEVLETDPARWHWLHVRDRIGDDRDVLAPLRPLIEVLAASPVATAFYTYSSLNRLCFSASSHFPWVNDGLPIVCPVQGACVVGTFHPQSGVDWPAAIRCDFRRAVTVVEEILAAARCNPSSDPGRITSYRYWRPVSRERGARCVRGSCSGLRRTS